MTFFLNHVGSCSTFISRFWNRDKLWWDTDQWQLSKNELDCFRSLSKSYQWMLFRFKFLSMGVQCCGFCIFINDWSLCNFKKPKLHEECIQFANILEETHTHTILDIFKVGAGYSTFTKTNSTPMSCEIVNEGISSNVEFRATFAHPLRVYLYMSNEKNKRQPS